MNSHNPFNTGGSGCTNDFRSADQLVDRIIGDAYHVVKEVYLALGNLTYIYNYLQKYGLIITVDSEEAIKDIPLSIGKFARIYSKSESAGYYFTDYLYVDDDTTGIRPNDPNATGSWISTKATGSNASFVRIWKYRAVANGETIIQLPTDIPIVGVQTIYVQGVRQDIGEGFTYNEGDATITLADELEAGNLVTVIIGITDPDMDIDIFAVLKGTDGASNIGTSTGKTVQQTLDTTDQFSGAYEDGPLTITSANRWITYNSERWYVKPDVTVPFSTTGLNATSWAVDSVKFKCASEMMVSNSFVTPEMFGAKGDNSTDDTSAFKMAIEYATSNRIELHLLAKSYRITSIEIPDNLIMIGAGRLTTLTKVKGDVKPLMVSKGNPTLDGVTSNTNPESQNIFLSSFKVALGWKAEGTQVTCGLLLSTSGSTIRDIDISDAYGIALATSGGNTLPTFGMENTFENIRIDTCGMHGWKSSGPHDSVVKNVIIIDSGQLSNNTYYGIWLLSSMNMRGDSLHVWHRAESLRNKYACLAESWGDDIVNSHFEGAYEAQLVITGQNNQYSNCKAYANWNPNPGYSNVVIRAPNNRYIGTCGGPGEGKADCFGVALGDGTEGEYAANCYVNITVNNTKLGGVDFTHEAGHNQVFLSGFCNNTTNVAFAGNLNAKGTSYLLSTVPEYLFQYFAGDKKPQY